MIMKNIFIKSLSIAMAVLILSLSFATISFSQDHPSPPDPWSTESQETYHLSRYYKFTPQIVAAVGNFLKNTDDVSVCLYIAKETGADPRSMALVKEKATCWKDVLKGYNFDSGRLFEDLGINVNLGVPKCYKHAFNEYKKWFSDPSREMDLSDMEIIDLVQLRLIVKLYGVTAGEVMKSRNKGADWTSLMITGGK
jgi:hypothetical protein